MKVQKVLNFFFSRSDGDLVTDEPPVRSIMPVLMPTRTESVVFFEQKIAREKISSFITEQRQKTGLHITPLHVFLWTFAAVLRQRPKLNRFASGGRLFQRRGIFMSYSMKKQKSDEGVLVARKVKIDDNWTLSDLVNALQEDINDAKSNRENSVDKELKIILALPVFVQRFIMSAGRWLDSHGWLPTSMTAPDPMFASMFVANLGSIGLDSAYHHLYEYGTISLFAVIGASTETEFCIRYTLDERVADGFYCLKALELVKETLENPYAHIKV